jgi:hypothetical protein
MTNTDCNTQPPDLRNNIAQAQRIADLAHAQAEAAGAAPEDCADAYHTAFVDAMRELGTPMPCHCPRCGDPAERKVSGWLMVPVQVSRVPAEVE